MANDTETRNAIRLMAQCLDSAAEATRALATVQCKDGNPMQVWGTMQRFFALQRMEQQANTQLANSAKN